MSAQMSVTEAFMAMAAMIIVLGFIVTYMCILPAIKVNKNYLTNLPKERTRQICDKGMDFIERKIIRGRQ